MRVRPNPLLTGPLPSRKYVQHLNTSGINVNHVMCFQDLFLCLHRPRATTTYNQDSRCQRRLNADDIACALSCGQSVSVVLLAHLHTRRFAPASGLAAQI